METENKTTIKCLPLEVISMILSHVDFSDVISFAATCSHLNNIVQSDQRIWRRKFSGIVEEKILNQLVDPEQINGNWFLEMKRFHILKKKIYNIVLSMPSKHCAKEEIELEDNEEFFNLAMSSSRNYFYACWILQDLLKKGDPILNKNMCERPYTLTDMYYAKTLLRHLIHSYLLIKWVQRKKKNQLAPEYELNFFLQWVDLDNFHNDDDLDAKIQSLVTKVEQLLNDGYNMSLKEKLMKGIITERNVLKAVSQVIYEQKHMTVTTTANVESLDMIKVVENKYGHMIALACIFQAVANRCGVNCKITTFPNHFFLEWTSEYENQGVKYMIDLHNGRLVMARRCPFSRNMYGMNYNRDVRKDSLLEYTVSAFIMTMGAITSWQTHNCLRLIDFLSFESPNDVMFYGQITYLMQEPVLDRIPTMNLLNVHEDHMHVLWNLTSLNVAKDKNPPKAIRIRKRIGDVKYAVGMVCRHRLYEYVCVVRSWNLQCDADFRNQPRHVRPGHNPQVIYNVIAADQSNRYVAQENLEDVKNPSRLFHIEYSISREFTHFDGFAYIPNEQKQYEYPEDLAVINMYETRAELRKRRGSF